MKARTCATVVLVAALVCTSTPARAQALHFGPHDISSLFTISKSQNKNEVLFAIHLDTQCAPVGDAPVYAYWRMYETGANVIQPLLSREEEAYGIARQQVAPRSAGSGGRIEITLRALPARPVVIETKPADGRCEATSVVTIGGERAYLYNVYAKVWMFGVDYLLLSGWSMDRTHVIHEKIAR